MQKDYSIHFTEFDLPNGMHVILHEDHKAPIHCLNIAYHVGSKNEVPGRSGFSHLFEHLMFEGSKNIPKGMFDKYITRAGGTNNAYTTEDKTNYYMTLPSHELELSFWLESDRILECVITEESLATQKDVVIEEKRERYDNAPYGSLSERMMRLAYQTYPYKWTVIGDMADIRSATLEDVRDFFANYYVPNNAVLSIAGDFNTDEGRDLVEKYYGDVPKGLVPFNRPDFNEPEQTAERREIVKGESVPLPATFWAYRIPPDGSRDALALDLLTDVLASGQSSRLYRKLVYEEKAASEVSAYVDVREMPGLAWFYAVGNTADEPLGKIEDLMEAVIAEVRDNGITDEELTKVKNRTEMRAAAGRVRVFSKAEMLAHAYIFWHDTNRYNTILDDYLTITKEDIKRVARTYLVPQKRNVVVFEVS
jgi:zinc protease